MKGICSVFILVLTLAALPACDTADPGPPVTPPPTGDDIVRGVNLTRLLEAPSEAELTEIRNAWQARSPLESRAYTVVSDDSFAGNMRLQVVSWESPGRAGRTYGALLIPASPPGQTVSRPVLVVLPGTTVVSLDDLLVDRGYENLMGQVIQFLPVPPGGRLVVGNGVIHASNAVPGDFGVRTEWVLAGLHGVLGAGIQANASRIGFHGFGAGGAVGIITASRIALMGRPASVRAIVSLSAPTAIHLPSFRFVARALIEDRPVDFPDAGRLGSEVLRPLRDGRLPESTARLGLLANGAAYYLPRIFPTMFIRHGEEDGMVPVEHAFYLREAAVAATVPTDFRTVPETSHYDLFENPQVRGQAVSFLRSNLVGAH